MIDNTAEVVPLPIPLHRSIQRHPSTQARALSRREQDRAHYLSCVRAAEQLRADAKRFRDMDEDISADEAVYGPLAKDYKAGVMARLETVAAFLEWEASKQDEMAASYRELVLGS